MNTSSIRSGPAPRTYVAAVIGPEHKPHRRAAYDYCNARPGPGILYPSLRNARSYHALDALNTGTCRLCKRPLTITETIKCRCGIRVGPEELAAYHQFIALAHCFLARVTEGYGML